MGFKVVVFVDAKHEVNGCLCCIHVCTLQQEKI